MIRSIHHVRRGMHAARGGCYLCGTNRSTDKGPLVDLGVTIDGEGVLLLCARHTRQAARLVGMIEPDEAEKAKAERDKAIQDASTAKMQAGRYKKLFEDIRAVDREGAADVQV